MNSKDVIKELKELGFKELHGSSNPFRYMNIPGEIRFLYTDKIGFHLKYNKKSESFDYWTRAQWNPITETLPIATMLVLYK